MDDLIAFFQARLDEDEALALQAAQVAGPDWTWKTEVPEGHGEPTDYIISLDGALLLDTMGGIEGEAPHVARHDPARVLRDVEADRKLLAMLERARAFNDHMFASTHPEGIASGEILSERMRAATQVLTMEEVARIRAARFSGHPDYRPQWAPTA